MFSTGLLTHGAQVAEDASGVSGRRLPGRLLSLALRGVCDMKNLRGPPKGYPRVPKTPGGGAGLQIEAFCGMP